MVKQRAAPQKPPRRRIQQPPPKPPRRRPPLKPKRVRRPAGPNTRYLSAGASVLGAGVGALLGGPAGSQLGAMIGGGLGSVVGAVTGLGRYQITSNAFLDAGPPMIVNRNNIPNSVLVRRREYLGEVITSSSVNTASIASYPINPGLSSTFPFLSQLAANFEEYVIEGLCFEFKSMSADALNSTNTALGNVVMATEYNAAAPNFTDKASMESTIFADSSKPSESMIHYIECSRTQTVISDLYIRTGSVPSGQDQKFFDLGNFQIGTFGFQAQSVDVGELWVSYQVVLLKPRIFTSLGNSNAYWHCTTVTGVTAAAPLGTAPVATANSTLVPAAATTSTVFTFPALPTTAEYQILYQVSGTAAAITAPILTLQNGVTFISDRTGGISSNTSIPGNGVTAGQFEILARVSVPAYQKVTGNPAASTVTFGTAGTIPTSVTTFDFWVLQMPYTAVSG